MEKLFEMAKKVCDKAEIFSVEHNDNSVLFENAKLQNIDSKFQSGISLRIIKDGKLGFAYTRNLMDRQELIGNALDSMQGGVEANYDFPLTKELPLLDTFDPSIEELQSSSMVEECGRVCDMLKSKTDAEIAAICLKHTGNIRIINSEGTDVSLAVGEYGMVAEAAYPGTGSGIWRVFSAKRFASMPDDIINQLIELYKISSEVVQPKGGKMKVMFMPNSMVTLNWRISSGASSKSIYEKVSPIGEKIGEKIFSDKITICDDPLNDQYPGARAFDDEGVSCKPLTIVDKGVLKSFFYDLDYAAKLNATPTGHGYKTTRWGGDPVGLKPGPALSHLNIKPGNKSFTDLVKSMDQGVIIESALGFHSGNIPNGDFSVGLNPGLYVENGEIVGRVKDAMVAGNLYETLKNVVEVGDTLYPAYGGGWVPAILCDQVSVATKS
jgi:PmbA protein